MLALQVFSAILFQQSSDSSYRIIVYSSRTLTPTKQNFIQLETIVHACEKFIVYILGGHFKIIKDYNPLVHLFNNAQSRMPLRTERWSLSLKEFDFTISHIKGTVNHDFLSLHPFDIKTKTDNITEEYVKKKKKIESKELNILLH